MPPGGPVLRTIPTGIRLTGRHSSLAPRLGSNQQSLQAYSDLRSLSMTVFRLVYQATEWSGGAGALRRCIQARHSFEDSRSHWNTSSIIMCFLRRRHIRAGIGQVCQVWMQPIHTKLLTWSVRMTIFSDFLIYQTVVIFRQICYPSDNLSFVICHSTPLVARQMLLFNKSSFPPQPATICSTELIGAHFLADVSVSCCELCFLYISIWILIASKEYSSKRAAIEFVPKVSSSFLVTCISHSFAIHRNATFSHDHLCVSSLSNHSCHWYSTFSCKKLDN